MVFAEAGDVLYGYFSTCITANCDQIDPLIGTFAFFFEGEGRDELQGISVVPANYYSNANIQQGNSVPSLDSIRQGRDASGNWYHWHGVIHWSNNNHGLQPSVKVYPPDVSVDVSTFDKLAYWMGRGLTDLTIGAASSYLGGPFLGALASLIVDVSDVAPRMGRVWEDATIPPNNTRICAGPLCFQLQTTHDGTRMYSN